MSEPALPDIPYRFERTHDADAVVEGWSVLAPGGESGVTVGVAGRIMLSRPQGKLAFAELRDNSGAIQLFAGEKWTGGFDEFAEANEFIGIIGGHTAAALQCFLTQRLDAKAQQFFQFVGIERLHRARSPA